MARLTKRVGENITYNQERKIDCCVYCDECSQGTANCKTVREMVKKLAEYEDLEEQGLLVKLPCKVGDTVYPIYYDYETDAYAIGKYIIYEIGIFSNEICFKREGKPAFKYSDFGKYVFLSKEEAEQALKDIEKGV